MSAALNYLCLLADLVAKRLFNFTIEYYGRLRKLAFSSDWVTSEQAAALSVMSNLMSNRIAAQARTGSAPTSAGSTTAADRLAARKEPGPSPG